MNIDAFAGVETFRLFIHLKGDADTNHCSRFPLNNNELYLILLSCFRNTGGEKANIFLSIDYCVSVTAMS